MTIEDVVLARASILARGERPSHRAILREMGGGSKRDVSRILRQLEAEPESAEVPEPPPPPVPEVDPVSLAEERLAEAQQAFVSARAHLRDCRLEYLIVSTPLFYEDDGKKLLVGSFDPTDEIWQEVLLDLRSAKADYDHALARRRAARESLAQAVKVHRRGLQERWVARYKHTLVEARDAWAQKLSSAPSDHAHAHAKKEYYAAVKAYEDAVAQAPFSTNGQVAGAP